MITRSGIEVAMNEEASHPDVLVADALQTDSTIVSPNDPGRGKCARNNGRTLDETRGRTHAVNLQVRDVEVHVEVLRHVPLGAGANPPAGPVFVAARLRKCKCAKAGASALQCAQDVIGCVVVADLRVMSCAEKIG